jgi:hypothetical protein
MTGWEKAHMIKYPETFERLAAVLGAIITGGWRLSPHGKSFIIDINIYLYSYHGRRTIYFVLASMISIQFYCFFWMNGDF